MSDSGRMKDAFDGDELREVLRDTFYQPERASERVPVPRGRRRAKPKPAHYDVICISLYTEDLARLDAKVEELKERGHRKMSRSALIRFALDTCDLESLPKGY